MDDLWVVDEALTGPRVRRQLARRHLLQALDDRLKRHEIPLSNSRHPMGTSQRRIV